MGALQKRRNCSAPILWDKGFNRIGLHSHFFGNTGFEASVFLLHPSFFEVKGGSGEEEFCPDIVPARGEKSAEGKVVFYQSNGALNPGGAAQAQMDASRRADILLLLFSLLTEGLLQDHPFFVPRPGGTAPACAERGTASPRCSIPLCWCIPAVYGICTLYPGFGCLFFMWSLFACALILQCALALVANSKGS